MFALIFYFILQLTKSNGYDGKRGLTGVGIIGETDPGCQCQCFDPNLGIKNQSSEFVYIHFNWIKTRHKDIATFCPPRYAYTRKAVFPNWQVFSYQV